MSTVTLTTGYLPKRLYSELRKWNPDGVLYVIDSAVSECIAKVDPARVEAIRVEKMEAASKVRFRVTVELAEAKS